MEKLTRKQAFDLSIEKWEGIVKTGETPKHIIDLDLAHHCGLCQKYKYNNKGYCLKCPIDVYAHYNFEAGCCHQNHPWAIWYENMTTENAQAVLDLIKSKQHKS